MLHDLAKCRHAAKLSRCSISMAPNLALGTGRGLAPTSLSLSFTGGSLPSGVTFSRSTTGTYFDIAGLLATAAIDAPRFDYEPVSHAAKGLLIEESRTNLALQSSAFNSSPTWNNNGNLATITANAAVSPTGATDADTIAATASGAGVYQGVTSVSTTTYAVSFFGKTVSGATAARTGNDANPGARVSLDVSTGVLSSPTGSVLSSSSLNAGSGWYRAAVAYTATGTINVPFIYTNTASAMTYAAWGAQMEAGAFPTSYIPTVAATVTRAADLATMTGASFSSWFNPAAGAFLVQGYSPASGTRTLLALDDGTANEQIILRTVGTTLRLVVIDGGVTVCDLAIGTIAANTAFKVAFRYQANNCAASLNGAAAVADTSVTLPTVDRMRIGSSQAGEYLCGCIAQIGSYSGIVVDAQLRALSA